MEKGELKYSIAVIPVSVLFHSIMHGLVFLVLELHGQNGQTVQKYAEIGPFASLDDQFWYKSDSILTVMHIGDTLAGAGFWIIEFELQPPHGEAMPDDQPRGEIRSSSFRALKISSLASVP